MGFFRRVPIITAARARASYPGLYLGYANTEKGPRPLRYKLANLHLTTFGPPGSGKSMLIASNLAHLLQSIICVDPKGQLAAISARKRALLGSTIICNPLNMFEDTLPHLESCGWNPLLELDPESNNFPSDAGCIADAIITKSAAGEAKFFDIGAEGVTELCIMWERITNPERPSLRNVKTMLSQPAGFNRKGQPVAGWAKMLQRMRASKIYAVSSRADRIYVRLADKNSHQTSFQDVIDTALKDFAFLDDDRLHVDMVRGKAIPWHKLHEEITTIYLICPVEELDPQQLGKWLRIFINLALRRLYKSSPGVDATLPRVLFMLDEFGSSLGRLEEIPKALNAIRDYRVSMWFVLQNLAQLKKYYPNEWQMFLSCSGVINTFKCGGDNETAEHLAKIFGQAELMVPTQTPDGRWSMTPKANPLIRAEDLTRLRPGETVSLIDPCPFPIRGHVPIYTDTPWNEGLDANPYYKPERAAREEIRRR